MTKAKRKIATRQPDFNKAKRQLGKEITQSCIDTLFGGLDDQLKAFERKLR